MIQATHLQCCLILLCSGWECSMTDPLICLWFWPTCSLVHQSISFLAISDQTGWFSRLTLSSFQFLHHSHHHTLTHLHAYYAFYILFYPFEHYSTSIHFDFGPMSDKDCEWKTISPLRENCLNVVYCIAQKLFYSNSTWNSIHNHFNSIFI